MEKRQDNIRHGSEKYIEINEKHTAAVSVQREQIDNMFREAEGTFSDEDQICAPAEPILSGQGNDAVYPEECCDAAEISDEDYERWKEGSEKGFWKTFIENIK